VAELLEAGGLVAPAEVAALAEAALLTANWTADLATTGCAVAAPEFGKDLPSAGFAGVPGDA